MGAWDSTPWGNDKAADWLDELGDKTGLIAQIESMLLEAASEANHEKCRAAACLLLLVGRAFAVEEETYRQAAARLRQIAALQLFRSEQRYRHAIEAEAAALDARFEGGKIPTEVASSLMLPAPRGAE